MWRIIRYGVLYGLLLSTSISYAQNNFGQKNETIKVRVANFAPNYFQDDTGNWTGLSVELSTVIIERAGFKAELIDLPWSRAMMYIKRGKIHYMTNLSKTDERSEFLQWIGPVRQDSLNLIVKKENVNLPIQKLDDFVQISKEHRKHFGYQDKIRYSDEFENKMHNDIDFNHSFEKVYIVDDNIKRTANGKILGFFESSLSISYRIDNDSESAGLAIHSYSVSKNNIYHGISKAGVSAEIYEKLRLSAEKCMNDGTIARIVTLWNSTKK
jgi:polar amino acid transport system substrate-binding protein